MASSTWIGTLRTRRSACEQYIDANLLRRLISITGRLRLKGLYHLASNGIKVHLQSSQRKNRASPNARKFIYQLHQSFAVFHDCYPFSNCPSQCTGLYPFAPTTSNSPFNLSQTLHPENPRLFWDLQSFQLIRQTR